MLTKLLKWLLWIVIIIVAVTILFLIYITVTDYKPPAEQKLKVYHRGNSSALQQGDPFTITTFNIGYAGLDRRQDFFMDGGTMSRSSSKEQTNINLQAITDFMSDTRSNMYILQEVDIDSSRSNRINENQVITTEFPKYQGIFAYNYKTPWVPIPLTHPMGSVKSGLLTLSEFKSTAHTRFDLPGKESWPVRLFELDRGFIESRFPVSNGKELVLINLHLSAFDKGGSIRKQQLEFLNNYINQENVNGNYLIVGGDWNHALPGTDHSKFPTEQEWPEWLQSFPGNFVPDGFLWAIDPDRPTVRTLDVAYQEGVNFLSVIDGFLVSPNVEISKVTGHNLNFEHSDHNPVTGTFILK